MGEVNQNLELLLIGGSFRKAVEMSQGEWTANKMTIGPDVPVTVRSQVRYADVLSMAGDYEEAAEIYRDILLKMQHHPELFNEEVIDVKLSLANILYRKDIDEAMVLIEGLEELVRKMPMDDTGIALKRKLAETMRDLGRYESALATFDEIYNFKCNIDSHSLDSLSSHVDIATVYLEQGRYMKAMDILVNVHKEANKIDPNHPCTLRTKRHIADVCMHYRVTMMACHKYEGIVKVQEARAPRSLETLTTLYKLSLAYLEDGKPKNALEKIEKVYKARKAETPWHPDTKRVEIDFIMMNLREGNISKATFLLFSALESKSECFDFGLVVDVPRNIAMFLRKSQKPHKLREAIGIYEYLYQKQCQMARLGPLHPETLLTKTHIAETHLHLGNPDEALRIFEEVLIVKTSVLNNDNMDCLDVQKHIAKIYYDQKKFHESFDHYCEVYRNERMYLGAYHDVTIETENRVDRFCLINPESNLIRAIAEGDLQSVSNICNEPGNTDIDAQDYYGCTPLHVAVIAGHPRIVRFLLGKGASLYVKNKSRKIPREMAKKNDVRNIFNIIIQLFMDVKLGNVRDMSEVLSFDDGEILNVMDEEGKTLLHRACQRGDTEMVKLLLNKGADPKKKDMSSESALDLAAKLNHVDIVQTMNKCLEEAEERDKFKLSPRQSGDIQDQTSD